MARHGGFGLDNHTSREKFSYDNFMQSDTHEITIDGKTFMHKSSGAARETNDDTDYHAVADGPSNIDLEHASILQKRSHINDSGSSAEK